MSGERHPWDEFGPELKRRRDELRLSVRRASRLAQEATGSIYPSDATWGNYEKNKKWGQPPEKFIIAACDVLGWDRAEAFEAAGYDLESPHVARYLTRSSRGWDDWINFYESMTPEQQAAHRAFIVALVGEQNAPEMPGPRTHPSGMKLSPDPEKPAKSTRRPKNASPRKRR